MNDHILTRSSNQSISHSTYQSIGQSNDDIHNEIMLTSMNSEDKFLHYYKGLLFLQIWFKNRRAKYRQIMNKKNPSKEKKQNPYQFRPNGMNVVMPQQLHHQSTYWGAPAGYQGFARPPPAMHTQLFKPSYSAASDPDRLYSREFTSQLSGHTAALPYWQGSMHSSERNYYYPESGSTSTYYNGETLSPEYYGASM